MYTSLYQDVIDEWVDSIAAGKAHVDPKDLPWTALRTLLSQTLYGGRVDNSFDQAALDAFIDAIFHAGSYDASAPLCVGNMVEGKSQSLLTLPDSFSRQVDILHQFSIINKY